MASVIKPNANGNVFEIKTIQAGAFRTLIEGLKEILTEVDLEFDTAGIKITAMDETHTVLVHLKLNADRFEHYYCPAKHVLGVNMIYFFKLIKTMGNNDSLTLYLPAANTNKLGIKMENSEKNTTTTYYLKLFDTNVQELNVPNMNFTSIIHMPSTDFQKICRDMSVLGEKVEITSAGADLIFRSAGDFAEQETVITENNGTIKVQRDPGAVTNNIVQGVFLLKHLVLFTKCTNLCQNVQLYLKNDFPLVLVYTVANLGEVKLILARLKEKRN